jgi:hypothetical protein
LFAGLINQAKHTVSSIALKYVARASVAVPFVIALGFVVAAVAAMLVQRYGHVMGYWLMAGGLAAIGVIAAIAVAAREHEEEVAEEKAEQTDTTAVLSDAATQAMAQAPLALLGTLLSIPGGTAAATKVARSLGRNYALVLLLLGIGGLLWPSTDQSDPPDAEKAGSLDDAHLSPVGGGRSSGVAALARDMVLRS